MPEGSRLARSCRLYAIRQLTDGRLALPEDEFGSTSWLSAEKVAAAAAAQETGGEPASNFALPSSVASRAASVAANASVDTTGWENEPEKARREKARRALAAAEQAAHAHAQAEYYAQQQAQQQAYEEVLHTGRVDNQLRGALRAVGASAQQCKSSVAKLRSMLAYIFEHLDISNLDLRFTTLHVELKRLTEQDTGSKVTGPKPGAGRLKTRRRVGYTREFKSALAWLNTEEGKAILKAAATSAGVQISEFSDPVLDLAPDERGPPPVPKLEPWGSFKRKEPEVTYNSSTSTLGTRGAPFKSPRG